MSKMEKLFQDNANKENLHIKQNEKTPKTPPPSPASSSGPSKTSLGCFTAALCKDDEEDSDSVEIETTVYERPKNEHNSVEHLKTDVQKVPNNAKYEHEDKVSAKVLETQQLERCTFNYYMTVSEYEMEDEKGYDNNEAQAVEKILSGGAERPEFEQIKTKLQPQLETAAMSIDNAIFQIVTQQYVAEAAAADVEKNAENVRKYGMILKQPTDIYKLLIYHATLKQKDADVLSDGLRLSAAEEALATYALENKNLFLNKNVLELGGGYSCLAGLMVGKYAQAETVQLTDGDDTCVQELQQTLSLNTWSCSTQCSLLRWENIEERAVAAATSFDVILAAECLTEREMHVPLIYTIWYYLKEDGMALVCSAEHGLKLYNFKQQCREMGFEVHQLTIYSELIWQKHKELLLRNKDYAQTEAYPILLQIKKKSPTSELPKRRSTTKLQKLVFSEYV